MNTSTRMFCRFLPVLLLTVAMLLTGTSLARAQPASEPNEAGLASARTTGEGVAAVTSEDRTRTASPPALQAGMSVKVPFGQRKPILHCMPLRVSLIKLQEGEEVLSTISGDTENWSIHLAESGPAGRTPLIVVKPLTDRTQRTNLFVTTTRRVYELVLASQPAARAAEGEEQTSNLLEFYYPDETVERYAAAERQTRLLATTSEVARLTPHIPLDEMRFDYRWKKDKHFPWEPASVFDDGARVYIKLPASAEHAAGAALFVTGLDGANAVLNYAMRGGMIITDRVFRRAQFVFSEPGKRGKAKKYRLHIWNEARQ